MKTLTQSQLVAMLQNHRGATFVTIMAKSPISGLRKTGNPNPGALKQTFVNGILGYDYAADVNAQLLREGKPANFQAAPRKWGVRVNSALVENNGEYYMSIRPLRTVATARFYTPEGTRLPKAVVAPFIPPARHSQTQGTDKEIVVRDYKVSGVQRIKIAGNVYRVVRDPVAPIRLPVAAPVAEPVAIPSR